MALKKSIIFTLLSVFILTAFLGACSSSSDKGKSSSRSEKSSSITSTEITSGTADDNNPKYGGEIKVAITSTPPTLDAMTTSAAATLMPMNHIYEMLVTYSEQSTIIPQLATKWDVDSDYKEFTFYLKKGVQFHNGNEMTAEDVKASFERYARIGYRKQQIFANLNRFEVVDSLTFKVVFNKSYPLFVNDLAFPSQGPIYIMPKELKDIDGGKLDNKQIIGTGPYQFEEFVPDQYIHLKKFDKYIPDTGIPASGFGGERIAYLDRINFLIVPEKTSRLNGLIAGEYDYAEELDPSSYYRLESEPNVRPDILSPVWTPHTIVNTLRGPLSNPKLRQAIRIALDDEAIMLAASGNKAFYHLKHSVFFPDQIWFSDIGKDKYNQKKVEEAKVLVKESGYNGEEIVYISNRDYEWMYQTSIALQSQLQNIGLNVKLKVVDWPTAVGYLLNNSYEKDFDLWVSGMGLYDVIDPSGLTSLFTSNILPYKSEEMKQAMTDGMNTADIEKRKAAYDKMMELIYRDVPIMVFGTMDTLNGCSEKYKGQKTWFALRFWNVWLEK